MSAVDSWRSNSERVSEARALFESPAMQHILAVTETENVLPTVTGDAPEIASIRAYHEAVGWQNCLTTIRSFAVALGAQPEIEEPTYPPPETTNP